MAKGIRRIGKRAGPAGEPTYHPRYRIRFVTAASLFDGHDAAIHIMRRILQAEGAEVIHLGHDRSVQEVVDAAIQEDAQGIAVSSYQGGHVEYFSFMLEYLRRKGCGHIRVYGGGGGVIAPEEIALLHKRGVARIFTPEDGRHLGLEGMIRQMLAECDHPPGKPLAALPKKFTPADQALIARAITTIEIGDQAEPLLRALGPRGRAPDPRRRAKPPQRTAPVLGITGTGGAGKSSLVDEILIRLLERFPEKKIAVLCVDPTRRRTGGALLGDRLRVNSAGRNDSVYFRSMATRRAHAATSAAVADSLRLLRAAGFDLILFETAGIGQSDSEVAELADLSLYVMTPEFGAPSQLEKIDMLDYADFVVLNKFDKPGAEDALREVRKAYQRNRKLFQANTSDLPVFPTCVHRFRDPGTNALFNAVFARLGWKFPALPAGPPDRAGLLPKNRGRYLQEVADTLRAYHAETDEQARLAGVAQHFHGALAAMGDKVPPKGRPFAKGDTPLRKHYNESLGALGSDTLEQLRGFDALRAAYAAKTQRYRVRDHDIEVDNHVVSLSGLDIPKVAVPATDSWSDQIRFLRGENVPGAFPYTAGVFPFKRQEEDPTRMFAGEGTAERTNARFHYLSRGQKAVRLSTAFDSVTLYGSDPHTRPDIYGKVGNSGVSVCCLDDAKRLYSGFDLCAPGTSVSMTINGPAPILLAFFFNAAVDAACERHLRVTGGWSAAQKAIAAWFRSRGVAKPKRPAYRAPLPDGHDGSGLGFLGLPADAVMDKKAYAKIRAEVLGNIRGTVQADILKEDQAQNTCIFSTEFALRMMGDVQEFFATHVVRNFYSVSISGYHIAEAGANPITQLAFTLANGFTYVEYFRAGRFGRRGMDVAAFAPNLSFFFSNGLDPEYSVIGRVARRIWAVALKRIYGADERGQKLKYHIQTSGRSLHAQEIDFNDIRTTLQALLAIEDNCNSLHTNAFDEAVTTPTEASVRRALAIQLIINRELGLARNENPLQGSYLVDHLTRLVEEEVLRLFEELDARGGVFGAMESNFQRSRIQEESLVYERKKQSGELPIVGVNTFVNPKGAAGHGTPELIRSSDAEKRSQVAQVDAVQACFRAEGAEALSRLKRAAAGGGNVFAELMETAKYCTLGQISRALFEVGGAYRRNT